MNDWLFAGLGWLLAFILVIYICREFRKDMRKKIKEIENR